MRMKRLLAILSLGGGVVACTGVLHANPPTQTITNPPAIAVGSGKKEVLTALGEPHGYLRRGETELFVYPSLDVEFVNGRVARIKRLDASAPDPRSEWKQRLLEEPRASSPGSPAMPTTAATVGTNTAATAQTTLGEAQAEPQRRTFAGRLAPGKRPQIGNPWLLWGGVAVGGIGLLGAVAAGIWLLVRAFQVHLGWGLACLLLPVAALVFVILHWEKSFRPFLSNLGAVLVLGGGMYLAYLGLVF